MPRELVTLACTECKRRNYYTTKNPKAGGGQAKRLEARKYCAACRRHTLHKESR